MIQERLAQAPGRNDWRLVACMGEGAEGSWPQRVAFLSSTPPAAEGASVREVMEFLRARRQEEYPPIIATEAQLGYSVTACQSKEILFGPCEGDGLILVRIEGSPDK